MAENLIKKDFIVYFSLRSYYLKIFYLFNLTYDAISVEARVIYVWMEKFNLLNDMQN